MNERVCRFCGKPIIGEEEVCSFCYNPIDNQAAPAFQVEKSVNSS